MEKQALRGDLKHLEHLFKLMQNSDYFDLRIYSFEMDMNIVRERLKNIHERIHNFLRKKDKEAFLQKYQRLQGEYDKNSPFLDDCRQAYSKSYHERFHGKTPDSEEYKFIHPQSFDSFLQKHASILEYRLRDASELEIGGTYFGVCKRWYWGHKYNVPLFELRRIEFYRSTEPYFLVGRSKENNETLRECFADNFWYRIGNTDDEPLSSAAVAATRAKLRDWYYSIIYHRYRPNLQTRREREYSSNTPLHFGGILRNTTTKRRRRRKKF